ncbi:MAG: molybdopterin-dependent oxidoreductase [Deltaproteobacteria bacterium]|nr:molybdopterin-dependent oxidoreductase [Deltaproteobacteria bacterium]
MGNVIGQRVLRREDPEMLRGEAKFVADINLPNMTHMAILRSPHAHARIKSIDTTAAAAMPGVVKVITSADLANKVMPMPCIWKPGVTGAPESFFPPHPYGLPGSSAVLATDRVRFIGDPVVAVVAETRAQAEDALEKVAVDYELLPVVIDAKSALEKGAPQLHETVPNNLNAYWRCGEKDKTDAAIKAAEVVVTLDIVNQRTINNPIEPRGALGDYNTATGEFTLYTSSQSPHNHRLLLAYLILGIPFNKLRVIAPNIGGSFGTKGYIYSDMVLVLFLSRELGRPVKWVDTRAGMMRGTVQGRDHVSTGTLAGTKDGKITALRCTSYANLGAYPSTIGPGVATAMMGRSLTSVYEVPAAFCDVYATFTNKVPLGAQRGSGRAEATFLVERLVDNYARQIGMDPAEVRRKNFIPKEKFPYENGLGWKYDSGDYRPAFDKALEMVGYADFADKKAEAKARGKRLGVGLASYVAIGGVGPSPRMGQEGMLGGTWESCNIKVHPTSEVTVIIGSKPHGQSHETVFAQIAADTFGVDPGQVQVLHSDTQRAPYGQGTYGSRSLSVQGASVHVTAKKIVEKMRAAAAHMLQANVDDIVYEGGRAYVKGSPDKAKRFDEIALGLWYAWDMPKGMEPALEATTFFDPPDFNYPFGSQAAVVEIDERTGAVEVKRFISVSDSGVPVNPMVIEGQIHGGVAHGIGQALFEQAIYGEDGTLLTDNFDEYPLPRAGHLPNVELATTVTPTPYTELGAKGAGELGTVGAAAAVGNAVVDALWDLGVRHVEMPFTPERVWRAIEAAKKA